MQTYALYMRDCCNCWHVFLQCYSCQILFACMVGYTFDSRSSHSEDLENGACGLSSLVLGIDGWVQGKGSQCH